MASAKSTSDLTGDRGTPGSERTERPELKGVDVAHSDGLCPALKQSKTGRNVARVRWWQFQVNVLEVEQHLCQ